MRRGIVARVINVDEGSVDDRHTFQEVGQDLAQIMTVLERHMCGQYDVGLDEQLVTSVIGAEILNLTN